jgi:lipopolysaccharide export system permease protein
MRFRVPLLQRYILGELLRTFTFVLICQTVLLVFVGIFQQASDSGLGPMQLIRILPYIVPSLLPFTIPAALLLTVCLVYGRIAGDLEVTAAKAAGINVLSLLLPSFILGAVMSVCSLILTDQAIPWAVGNIERTLVSTMEDIILERLRTERQFIDRHTGLHVVVTDVEGRRLLNPVFRLMKHREQIGTMWADEATIDLDLEHREAIIHLKNGTIDTPERGRVFVTEDTVPVRWQAADEELKPRHLPISEIQHELRGTLESRARAEERQAIEATMALTQGDFDWLLDPRGPQHRALRESQVRYQKLNTEMHSRYAFSCSCFFFVLIGSPLAVMKAQSKFLTSFLYCFVPIVAGYYPLALGLMAQAKRGNVDPAWSMWIGNALLLAAGWILLRRVMRH